MTRERELIARRGDERYVRRDRRGRFTTDQVDVGRSLAEDRRRRAKTVCVPGQGDEGDRRTPPCHAMTAARCPSDVVTRGIGRRNGCGGGPRRLTRYYWLVILTA